MSKHQKLSVFVSLLLRHKPEVIGLTLDDQGYLSVDKLIKGINDSGREIDKGILDDIVDSDDKGRYSYNSDKTMIRANQGHSVEVNLELQELAPPPTLYHGTSVKHIDSIMKEGLSKQSRLHVHLSDSRDTAMSVGSRRGKPVILSVNSELAHKDGVKFFKSENGVWLVDKVDLKYLSK